MSALEPKGRHPRRDLLAPLGVVLVISGIVVIVLAAMTSLLVAPPGVFLVVSGIGLVVASEYRDEADLDYSRLGGLKVRVRVNADPAEDTPAARVRRRLPRRSPSGCRLAQAVNKRREGRQ